MFLALLHIMNLIVDQGNSSVKIGVFDNDRLVESLRFDEFGLREADALLCKYSVRKAIVSTVVKTDDKLCEFLKDRVDKFVFLDENTAVPIENLYETPKTLGRDRLAVCVGANYLKPDSNLLVIDIGTAMTFDVVNSKNQYVGGNISLGLDMRLKALNFFTEKLPLVNVKEEAKLIGTNTEDAIFSGVVNGMIGEIDGFIREIMLIFPNISVFLTGGASFFFERKLKSSIFANQNLLLIGLNRILNY